MLGALHHMDDPAAALVECIRVLAPAGLLSIFEPTARLVERARQRFPEHPDPADPSPLVGDMMVQARHGEFLDVYSIRHPS